MALLGPVPCKGRTYIPVELTNKLVLGYPVQAETLFFKIYFMVFLFYFNIYIVQVAFWCFLSFGGGSKFKQVFLET